MFAYGKFVKDKKIKWYIAAMLLFIFGLMSKPMLVTLPFVLLLIDYWPLERQISPRLVVEKAPFFLLSIVSSVVTFLVQRNYGAMAIGESFGIMTRINNAIVSYSIYIWKMIWPVRLAVLYPHQGDTLSKYQIVFSVLAIAAICICIFILRKHKFLTVGWLWFIGTLIPVTGIVQVGQQAYADRYTYIPLVGLFVMLAFGGKVFLSKKNRVLLSVILMLLWSFINFGMLGYWQDSESLYKNALRNTKNNYIILGNYILHMMGQQKYYQAVELSRELLKIKPDSATAYSNLGISLAETGQLDEAQKQFESALKFSPGSSQIYYNLALISKKKGKLDDAAAYYRKTIQAESNFAQGYIGLGEILIEQNQTDEAIETYRAGLQILPDNLQLKQAFDAALKKNGTK
jgi:Tfp pilus assembly protein PilF